MKELLRNWLGIKKLELALTVQDKAIGEYLFWLGALTSKAKLSINKLAELKNSPEIAELLLDYIESLSMNALKSAKLSDDIAAQTVIIDVRSKLGETRRKILGRK